MMLNKNEDNVQLDNKANITNNDVIDMYLNANETKLPSYDEFNMMIESIRGRLNCSNNISVKSKGSSVNGSNIDNDIVGRKYSHLLMLINKDNTQCECKDKNNQLNEMSLSVPLKKKKKKTLIRSGSVFNENERRKERFYILNAHTGKNGLVKVFSQLNCREERNVKESKNDNNNNDSVNTREYKWNRSNSSSGVNVMNWIEHEKRSQRDKGSKQYINNNNNSNNNDNSNNIMQRKISFDKTYFSSKLNNFSYKLFNNYNNNNNKSNSINIPSSSKHYPFNHNFNSFHNNWY
jgi:hypothetical protein